VEQPGFAKVAHRGMAWLTMEVMAPVRDKVTPVSRAVATGASAGGSRIASASTANISACAIGGMCTWSILSSSAQPQPRLSAALRACRHRRRAQAACDSSVGTMCGTKQRR
jgi:hypothetical protein